MLQSEILQPIYILFVHLATWDNKESSERVEVIEVLSLFFTLSWYRYRERQKGKMETFKSQVDELSHRLEQLQSEKDSLESRNRMLERVMQIKGDLNSAATDSWVSS